MTTRQRVPAHEQAAKATQFRALHNDGIFVLPCAWDAGSARLFASAGFAAIGTTSGGVNWSAGRPDYVYSVDRADMISAYGQIAKAVEVPVSGDLENGYGPTTDDVARTIRLSVEHGMVGGSIEDQTSETAPGLFPVGQAVERIAAAREAADASGIDYTITARAESYFGGVTNPFYDAIERANRYALAGADCVFIPGLSTLEELRSAVDAIDAPMGVGIGSGGAELTLDALAEIGVRRVSTGGLLPRALAGFVTRASREMLDLGTFDYGQGAISDIEIDGLHTQSPLS